VRTISTFFDSSDKNQRSMVRLPGASVNYGMAARDESNTWRGVVSHYSGFCSRAESTRH
jgi:hypothetical protein